MPILLLLQEDGAGTASEELFRRDLAGNGFHRLWELVWKECLRNGGRLQELAERLFEAAYGEKYPAMLSDPRLARRRMDSMEKNIRLGALQDAMEDEGLRENRREQRLEFPLPDLEIGGTVFRGRCDRLEILSDGSVLIFDYKSGKADRYKKSLQLAAYSIALQRAGESPGASAAVFLSLADGSSAGAGNDAPSWLGLGKTSLEGLEAQALQAMDRAAGSFATGLFPPDYDSDQCTRCSFSALCRRRDFRAEEEENGEEE